MQQNSKTLWGMIALSLAVHLVFYTWFYYKKHVPANTRHGVVSVSFVQSVDHEASVAKARKAKSQPSHEATPTQTSQSNAAEDSKVQNAEPGDPAAIQRESDIFIGAVTRLLEQRKIYPQQAIDREEEGKVIVGLTLDRDGLLTAANLEGPSPFQLLNEAALRTVRAVGHFPKVPDVVPAPIHLHVPMVYRIERN